MKRLILVLMLVGGLALLARAGGQVEVGGWDGDYQTGQGGEFTLIGLTSEFTPSSYSGLTSNSVLNLFQTFYSRTRNRPRTATRIRPTRRRSVRTPSMAARRRVTGGDPISVGTGWLYRQFATATWETGLSYDYGSGRLDFRRCSSEGKSGGWRERAA